MSEPVLTYVIDTNILSKLVKDPPDVLVERLRQGTNSILLVSEAVVYEVERGLYKLGASTQLTHFRERVLPNFILVPIDRAHWRATAQLWADASRRGRVLSDIDLLLVALAVRFDAVLVTVDRDYSAFPSIPTQNWLGSG